MNKQDRQGVRTPADLERKYNFGRVLSDTEISYEQMLSMLNRQNQMISQLTQTISQFMADTNARLSELEKAIAPTYEKGEVFYVATDYTLSSFNLTEDTVFVIDTITDLEGVAVEEMLSAGAYTVVFSALNDNTVNAELSVTLESDLTTGLCVGDKVYFTEDEQGALCLAYAIEV